MKIPVPVPSAGDVHRPGDEGSAEAASPRLTARGEAGDPRGCGVRTSLHPRHGSHRHLFHPSAERPSKSTGEFEMSPKGSVKV